VNDIAAWLRARLDSHAETHQRIIPAEGQNPDHEREADSDGFWALWESSLGCWSSCSASTTKPSSRHPARPGRHDPHRCVARAGRARPQAAGYRHRHADAYREEWDV